MTATDVNNPVEYVRNLSPEDQDQVLLTLLREAVRIYGNMGQIPIKDEEGKPFGYYIPQGASEYRTARFIAEMPPEVREQMLKPLPPDFDPNNTFEFEELINEPLEQAGAA
jgi:hypothetical protein